MDSRKPLRLTLVLGAVVLAVAAFVGGALTERSRDTSSAETPSTATRPARKVFVYGDSLVVQSEAYLQPVADSLDLKIKAHAFGGIAPCDALDWLADDLRASRPDIVVFAFSGNSLTECMRLPSGELATGDEIPTKYRADLEGAIKMASSAGVPFLLASPPASDPFPEAWGRIDGLYRDLAASHGPYVQYTDAGTDIAPRGEYTDEQSCLPFERRLASELGLDCGQHDLIDVRAPDGVHFCAAPGDAETIGSCTEYSSGALRYAIALVSGARLNLDYLAGLPSAGTEITR